MDMWKYFAIGHETHRICNPLSSAKVDELVERLELPADGRLLDIACGKGELLARSVRRWNCRAVGVDLSPPFVADARATVAGLDPLPEIVEANGSDYAAEAGSFDAACCIGATWIWGGLDGTLRALAGFVTPRGVVVVGEPFWRSDPAAEYLAAAGLEKDSFGTHQSNVQAGLDQGLGLLHTIVSGEDDWDRYEGYQWAAAERYAVDNPDDPDLPDLMQQMHRARDAYLGGGRDSLGWAIYMFQKGSYKPRS